MEYQPEKKIKQTSQRTSNKNLNKKWVSRRKRLRTSPSIHRQEVLQLCAILSLNQPNLTSKTLVPAAQGSQKGSGARENCTTTNTPNLAVASSSNAYNTSAPVFNMAKSATMVNLNSNQGNSPTPTLPLAEKRQDIATSTGDMAAIQQQAMRHVITITNSIFFLMANSRTLAQQIRLVSWRHWPAYYRS